MLLRNQDLNPATIHDQCDVAAVGGCVRSEERSDGLIADDVAVCGVVEQQAIIGDAEQ